jgi:PHD/YefM family antitoxin component YafN of YafNO toxin-antitoxin module
MPRQTPRCSAAGCFGWRLNRGVYMFDVYVKQLSEINQDYTGISKILDNHDRIILTTNGENKAVLINIDDYSEFEAYAHKEYINRKLSEAEKNLTWINEQDFWEDDD